MLKRLLLSVFLMVIVCSCTPSGGLHRNYIISQQYEELEEATEPNKATP